MLKKWVSGFALSVLPAFAFAHPGHGESGFLQAFVHPFTGADHLLMMLGIGIWAGRMAGAVRWQLPLTFLLAMLGGWALGANHLVLPGVETGIAAGLIVLGALLIAQTALPRVLQLTITAGFALLHGMAHGVELGASAPLLAATGFLSAGALLHGAGIGLVTLLPDDRAATYRMFGTVLALLGGGLLVAA
jgi:urease accessory protein